MVSNLRKIIKTLIVCSIILLFIIPFSSAQACVATTWSTQNVNSNFALSSLALDSTGSPHIAFNPVYTDNTVALQYSSWTGSGWDTTTIEKWNFKWGGICPSLVLDKNGYPHIAYMVQKFGENGIGVDVSIKYACWTGSSWSISTVDPSGFMGLSIAIDSKGNPHISGIDGNIVVYYSLTETGWEKTIVDSPSLSVAGQTSLAFDSNDNPHIAYPGRNNFLKYAVWDGGNWNIETLQTGNIGLAASLALDKNDYPHISYACDDGAGYYLHYVRWDGIGWNFETITAAGVVGELSSLSLNSVDNPSIACGSSTGLKYVRWTGSEWNVKTVDQTLGYLFPCLAMDPFDNAHISYSADVLKYTCEVSVSQAGSKVAGEGQIKNSINAKKATFDFNVMVHHKSLELKGNLQYEDRTANIKIHSKDIDSFVVSQDGTKAAFTGTCKINGVDYSFRVYVEDNGEPGRNDVFSITLGNGYSADGTLHRGNIQMHTK
jgi:hypothetical protein